MHKNTKGRLIKIIVGVIGTMAVIAIIIWRRGFPFTGGSLSIRAFVIVSGIFGVFPYLTMLGILGVEDFERKKSSKYDGPMSSYYDFEHSRKNWVKHIFACMIGVLSAYLIWQLNESYK